MKTSGVVEHLSNLPLMKGKDGEKKYLRAEVCMFVELLHVCLINW